MQQRNYLGKSATAVAMCTALAWAACVAFGGQARPQEWNILLITSDEHNAKMMGCAGHPVIQTPGMDRLAREGTMFTRAYCAVPVCAPTRQTLITGRYPEEHGQFSNSHRFDERNLTWAHHFKQHGYTTACIGKMHNNNEQFTFGFDVRLRQGEGDEEADSAIPKGRRGGGKYTLDPTEQKIYDGIADTRLRGWPVENAEATGDGLVCHSAIQYLRKNRDRKFFLHVSMVKPHWPWNAPRDFYFLYDPRKIDLPPVIPGGLANDPVPQEEFTKFKWNEMTEAQRRLGRARYYGSLSWLDSHVKQLLETLDELKLTDRTLVIYTTDHGDMAAEKGLWLKTLMFDASARVPLLMRMPGVLKPGTTNGVLVNHVDLFPTLAGLVGTDKDLPANLTGKDLTGSILRGEPGPEYTFSVYGIRSPDAAPERVMARSQRWKLVRYDRYLNEGRGLVLYDMEKDPDEVANLARDPRYKDIVAAHSAAMDRFLASLKKPDYPVVRLEKERKQRVK